MDHPADRMTSRAEEGVRAEPTVQAEMRIVWGDGLGIPDGREIRIEVSDGALVLRRPGADAEVVVSAADDLEMVWLSPIETRQLLGTWWQRHVGGSLFAGVSRLFARGAHRKLEDLGLGTDPGVGLEAVHGALVVLSAGRPVLAVPLAPFVNGYAADNSDARALSRAPALARALGATLERGDAARFDSRALRACAIRRSGASWPAVALAVVLCVAACVLGVASWPIDPNRSLLTAAHFAVPAAALLVPPAVMLALARRRLWRLLEAPPDPEGRTVVALLPDTHDSFSQLQVCRDDVVIIQAGGAEFWVPGPDRDGVAAVEVYDEDLVMLDRHDRVLPPVLRTADVVSDDASLARLRVVGEDAGITVRDLRRLPCPRALGLAHPLPYDEDPWFALTSSSWSRGGLGTVLPSYLTFVGVLIVAPGAVGAAVNAPSWGWIALLLWVVAAGLRTWWGLSFRLWRRRIIKSQERS